VSINNKSTIHSIYNTINFWFDNW